jgi:hypothetical protein
MIRASELPAEKNCALLSLYAFSKLHPNCCKPQISTVAQYPVEVNMVLRLQSSRKSITITQRNIKNHTPAEDN